MPLECMRLGNVHMFTGKRALEKTLLLSIYMDYGMGHMLKDRQDGEVAHI